MLSLRPDQTLSPPRSVKTGTSTDSDHPREFVAMNRKYTTGATGTLPSTMSSTFVGIVSRFTAKILFRRLCEKSG